VTVVVDYVVASGKKELSRTRVEVDGTDVHASDAGGDPTITFTLTPPLADAVAQGELDLSVGFMRGAIKMAGDFGALLHVLPTLAKTPGL
jgi:hypothetical protein